MLCDIRSIRTKVIKDYDKWKKELNEQEYKDLDILEANIKMKEVMKNENKKHV